MEKILVEFVNTCPCCDGTTREVVRIAKEYPEEIEVKIYYAGKDFDYIKKYGPLMKGTLIINEKEKIDQFKKDTIQEAIEKAVEYVRGKKEC